MHGLEQVPNNILVAWETDNILGNPLTMNFTRPSDEGSVESCLPGRHTGYQHNGTRFGVKWRQEGRDLVLVKRLSTPTKLLRSST